MNNGHPPNGTLTAKQRRAIGILLITPTITAAAASVGVGEQTLYQWLAEPSFATAYRQARAEVVAHAAAQVQRAASTAVAVLVDVMNNPDELSMTRITAAHMVLELAFDGTRTAGQVEQP